MLKVGHNMSIMGLNLKHNRVENKAMLESIMGTKFWHNLPSPINGMQ